MANMFSGKQEKHIPKTLSECTRSDATVDNLHAWAERLENWGAIFFVVLIIVGIIATVVETIQVADVNKDMAFSAFLTSAITWGVYAFIEYCAFHVLALLISALACITQNTMISADVALYEAAKNAPASEKTPTSPSAHSASAPKPNANIISKMASDAQSSGAMWECKYCLAYNKKEANFCKECGQPKGKE